MRWLNVFAALSGFIALGMLVYAAHGLARDVAAATTDRIQIAAFIQLGAAAAGLAISNRAGRVNLIAGVLILGGAAVFSGTLYAVSLLSTKATLAPMGGVTMLLGWLTLAFAKPASR